MADRIRSLLRTGTLLLGACVAWAAAAEPPSKPNIVLMLIDDMGYGDIGPFGSKVNRTPNLDRLAAEGMKLTSFYACPVCTPSRAQILTGCYAKRVSLPNVIGPGAAVGISAAERTVAQLLKAQGYATQCIGKWHVGDQPEFFPTRHGFDHYLGLPYSNDMIRKSGKTGVPCVPLLRDETLLEEVSAEGQNTLTARYTEEALTFIRANRDKPFFLYFPQTAVHVPLHPGDAFRGKSGNGTYGDWVEEVDWSLGRVLDALRELKLAERTLVVFTSDNGPWLTQGKNGGVAGPLRGGKGSTYEGGQRVPTIAWWPRQIAAGSTCDAVMANIDLLPTFVGLAGGRVPADRVIDGRDVWPLLSGAAKESPHEAFYYFRSETLEAVRSGPWKLELPPKSKTPVLYNLDAEIGETTDVSAQHPDEVKRLQALAAAMDEDLGAQKRGPGVRPCGQAENPQVLTGGEPGPARKPPRRARPKADGFKPGDVMDSVDAPQIAGQPFTIRCEVEPKSRSGIIVAHGGIGVGYALYLSDGRLAFAVRRGAADVVVVRSDGEAPSGRFTAEAALAADGGMTMSINGKGIASGRAGGLIPRQPQENFCVGHDDGKPVTDYGVAGAFEGSIDNLAVKVGTAP